MRTFKLAAIAAVAITAAAAGSQVRGDVYGYPYTPTYSSYPVGNSNCPSGQCGTSAAGAVVFLCTVLFVFELLPGNGHPGGGDLSVQQLPELSERFVQARARTAPAALAATARAVRAGQMAAARTDAAGRARREPANRETVPANCPNGQCTPGRNRDYSGSQDDPVAAELLAARLFPAGTAVFADELVERPAFSPQLRRWARPIGTTETATTNWRARSTTNAA